MWIPRIPGPRVLSMRAANAFKPCTPFIDCTADLFRLSRDTGLIPAPKWNSSHSLGIPLPGAKTLPAASTEWESFTVLDAFPSSDESLDTQILFTAFTEGRLDNVWQCTSSGNRSDRCSRSSRAIFSSGVMRSMSVKLQWSLPSTVSSNRAASLAAATANESSDSKQPGGSQNPASRTKTRSLMANARPAICHLCSNSVVSTATPPTDSSRPRAPE
mmetsp:Transcript_19646/g.78179  ORF Transcript_19646/g.78179 Transcript_19646/m.78179 type:complete len:216 (+) Transcript_19646:3921-4568(+)